MAAHDYGPNCQAQILDGWLLDLTRFYSDRLLAIDAAVAG